MNCARCGHPATELVPVGPTLVCKPCSEDIPPIARPTTPEVQVVRLEDIEYQPPEVLQRLGFK